MRYGTTPTFIIAEPIQRCSSTQAAPRRRHYSFIPSITPVREVEDTTNNQTQTTTTTTLKTAIPPPIVTSETHLSNHSGYMRKRERTRLLRHEWADHYFNLHGTSLDMHDTVTSTEGSHDSRVLDTINVDDYNVHAYTTASSSKLQAAFKKSLGGGSGTKEPSFAFTLIPEDQRDKKVLFSRSSAGNHHFAVNSGRDRVEWMRKIMLAKALKKNEAQAF